MEKREKKRLYAEQYRKTHRKELVEKAKLYTQAHEQQVKEYQKKYRAEHKDKQREYIKNWKQQNPERKKELNRKWAKAHPEYRRKKEKEWCKTEKGKLNQHRKNTRRKAYRRKLGAILLNQPFEKSVGHHINKDTVIYLPEELHTSVKHNLRTGLNMELINKTALEWLHYGTKRSSLYPCQ